MIREYYKSRPADKISFRSQFNRDFILTESLRECKISTNKRWILIPWKPGLHVDSRLLTRCFSSSERERSKRPDSEDQESGFFYQKLRFRTRSRIAQS